MLFRSYAPRPPLAEFIADFWLYEDYVGVHPHERILPTGTFELVFNLREDQMRIYRGAEGVDCRMFQGAVISGTYSEPFMSDCVEEIALLGVHFKPGGAFAVLGINAWELSNAHVDLSALWGSTASLLREQLCSLRTPEARFLLLERVLLKRLADRSGHHPAVRGGLVHLGHSGGRTPIADLARAVGLTQRRFTDLFATEVGLTPKVFSRVLRVQRAVTLCAAERTVDWPGLAARCGYFDQSHLNRDFRQFTGASPAEFHQKQEELKLAGVHIKRHHLPVAK